MKEKYRIYFRTKKTHGENFTAIWKLNNLGYDEHLAGIIHNNELTTYTKTLDLIKTTTIKP